MTSQITPAGFSPASRARSTAASVWPVRSSTPPGLAFSGKHVAGLDEVARRARGSIATWIVRARSAALMPVVMPSRASTETVNAVSNGDSFLAAISSQAELVAALRRQREADQPAPLLGHEVDRLGRRELGGERQVALVLAVLVVADDDHPPGADLLQRLFDASRTAVGAHRATSFSTYLASTSTSRLTRRPGSGRRRASCARASRGSATRRTTRRRSRTPSARRRPPRSSLSPPCSAAVPAGRRTLRPARSRRPRPRGRSRRRRRGPARSARRAGRSRAAAARG